MKATGRALRFLAVLFLAALVLVPVVESAHSHGDREMARPCAVCVATHHSPAAAAVAIAPAPAVALSAPALVSFVAVSSREDGSPHSGRAPPLA